VRGQTNDLIFRRNIIRDTRPAESRRQSVGIRIEESVGEIRLEENEIDAKTGIDDRRTRE